MPTTLKALKPLTTKTSKPETLNPVMRYVETRNPREKIRYVEPCLPCARVSVETLLDEFFLHVRVVRA